MLKFACAVVLYKPSMTEINKLVNLSGLYDEFFVWDNSSDDSEFREVILKVSNIYIHNNKNDGLAIPYNYFINVCNNQSIDILCILDQDTMLTVSNVKNIKSWIEDIHSDNCAIYAPRLEGTSRKNWIINSNSFLNIKTIIENDLKYDEYYFLDRLDADFCNQIINKKLKILIDEEVVVNHHIGDGLKNEHSVLRHYYMFRNRIYFNLKFYPKYFAILLTLLQDVKHIITIILGENNKIKKISQLIEGRKNYKSEIRRRQD